MDEINNIYAITDNNLGTVLLSDLVNDGFFLSSDDNAISSMEGTLCFDESANEYVLVNMVPTNMSSSDSTLSPTYLPTLNNSNSSSGDLSVFQDGGQVMLLNNGSLLASNEDNLDSAISDFFNLDHMLNTSLLEKPSIAFSKSPDDQSDDSIQSSKNEFSNTLVKLTGSTKTDETIPSLSQNRINLFDEDDEYTHKKYYCKLCNVKFFTLKEYKAHWMSHKEKNHKCDICGTSFNKIKNLILHEVLHNVSDTTCPLDDCRKKFKRFASLKAHLKTHEEEETLTCTKCGDEFTSQLYLELHHKHHQQCQTSNGENSVKADMIFDCKLCHREFSDLCAFNAHKKEHEKIKRALAPKRSKKKTSNGVSASRINRCKVCPKWFYKPSQLIRHMRIHTGERPFECTVCHKAFNQANSLKIHMLKHTGDRPYQCQFCSTAFSQRGNLRQHIHRVHSIPKIEEKVFKCEECSCIFKKLCSLNAHKNRVHQKRCTVADDETDDTCNNITIENGFDDIDDEDFDVLLEKKRFVNTITISLGCDIEEAAQQRVLVNKRGNVRYYRCSHCPKQSTTLKDIIRHLKTTILGKPFKCQFCPTKFSQQSVYLTHLTLHTSAPKYCCDICRETFSNPAELKMHSKMHGHFNDNQLCMLCLKTYPNAEMNTHRCSSLFQSTDSNLEPTNIKTSTIVKVHGDKINLVLPPYVCNQCDLVFESYLRLKGHLRSHDANICEICNFLFPTKEKLQEHSIIHSHEVFKEGNAKDGVTKRKRRIGKTKTNSKEYQLPCSLCNKTYTNVISLKRHEKQVHQKLTQQKEENFDEKHEAEVSGIVQSNSIDDTDNGTELADVDVNLNQLDNNIMELDNDPSTFMDELPNSINVSVDSTTDETLPNDVNDRNLPSELLTIDPLECWLDNIPTNNVEPMEVEADPLLLSLNLTGAVIYRCTKCMQQYSTELELQKHFEKSTTCNNGMPNVASNFFYACNTCYLTFHSLQSFLRHLQTHEGLKMFSCHYCGEQNKTQVELTQHIAQHALNNEYPCIHCGELCASADNVKKHIIDIHLMSSADVKKNDTKRRKNVGSELLLTDREKMALAEQKPTKYSSISEKVLSSLLKNGIEKDSSAKNDAISDGSNNYSQMAVKKSMLAKDNTCDYCGRGFKKLCDLKRHVRTHTGEKPFKCDYCSKCFRVKSILNCHLKTHFTVNNIFCHVCNRFFASVGSLKIHMRLHTGDRPYQCLFCKETFRTSGHRDSHHRKHTNTKKDETESAADSITLDRLGLTLVDADADVHFLFNDIASTDIFKFQELDDLSELQSTKSIQNGSIGQKSIDLGLNIGSRLRKSIICDQCDKSFASYKTLKTHKVRHHQQLLSLPIQDENEPESRNGKEIDKWIVQDDLGFVSLVGKNSPLKKQSDTIVDDFYVMDKQLDLNSMMPDIFSE